MVKYKAKNLTNNFEIKYKVILWIINARHNVVIARHKANNITNNSVIDIKS